MPKSQVVTTKTGSGSAAAKKANAQVDDDAPAADDAAVVPVSASSSPAVFAGWNLLSGSILLPWLLPKHAGTGTLFC
jgi:hypothetical protein